MSTSETITQASIQTISHTDMSIFSLISSADITGKAVIFILFMASIWSWAIIFDKIVKYRKTRKKIERFEKLFWSGQMLDQLYDKVKKAADNPLSLVFVAAMNEWKRTTPSGKQDSGVVSIGLKTRIMQSMDIIRNRELEKLEDSLGFLATIGSAAPFIGLFGTVWGIMNSFQSIASSKNTSLAVVAPGIAEALLATAIGLFAAIPALIFYNYLVGEVSKISNKMDDFVTELHTLLSRAIDSESK